MSDTASSGSVAPTPPDQLFSVAGKTVVVTGGTRGIGRMIAGGFVAAGATVVVASRRAEAVQATVAELAPFGECSGVPADLSTEEGSRRFAEEVGADHPRVDVLVNNAGATWGAPLEEYPPEAFDKVLGVNVKAPFALSVALLPALRAAANIDDPARIINIGSSDGIRVPSTDNYAYAASKAALHMLNRQLALRLASEAITVNAIAPGPFDSKMMAFLLDDPTGRAAVAGHVPLGRVGRPDDLAGTALFLASRAGAYLTGVVLPVDGGISAR
jgi:NAD(P)-dependent dehydrogenase (short-subunit alcohol dehydrogenase family)